MRLTINTQMLVLGCSLLVPALLIKLKSLSGLAFRLVIQQLWRSSASDFLYILRGALVATAAVFTNHFFPKDMTVVIGVIVIGFTFWIIYTGRTYARLMTRPLIHQTFYGLLFTAILEMLGGFFIFLSIFI